MIDSVAIFGDSWSVSAYEKQHNEPGSETPIPVSFQTLFYQHNIKVHNFSVNGCSNNDQLQYIDSYKQIIKNCDVILVCQTDPLRNFCEAKSNTIDTRKALLVDVYSDINDLAEHLCGQFYQSLSLIQQDINVPIVIFTGCSKICKKYVCNNLDSIDPCWTKIVDPELDSDSYFDSWGRALSVTDFLANKFPQNSTQLKRSFFQVQDNLQNRMAVWHSNKNFGYAHAGQGAYDIMFKKIMQKIGEIDDRSQAHSR